MPRIDIAELQVLLEKHRPQFEAYRDLLIKWNKTYNLTSITRPDEIWEKHFLDSITPLPLLPEQGSILDVGAGAGFPGIPLKIVRPALSVTLLEATGKKCTFCEAVIRELDLKDINVARARVEDIGNGLDKFDMVISRATFSTEDLVKHLTRYLKDKKSRIIAMKSGDEGYSGKAEKFETTLPHSGAKRTIFVIS